MWVYLLIHALASTGVKINLEHLSLIEISKTNIKFRTKISNYVDMNYRKNLLIHALI